MTSKRILTICAALTAASAAGAAGTSPAQAQQGYPVPPGAIYQAAPPPYVPGGYPADYRRGSGAPDFDALEDDDAPNAQSSTALPPPGPVLSPDDPRYGRPYGAPPVYSNRGGAPTGPILSPDDPRYGRPDGASPVYSNRSGAPTGPILSPDDPRYGRPDGPPPVIYSDRPAGPPEQTYSDRGSAAPNQDDRGLRPPEAVGAPGTVTGSVPPPVGADGRPMVLSALPPEEQPEAAPVQLPPNLRRQEVTFPTKEPAGTLIVDTPNTYLYYVLGGGRAIRYGVRVGRDGFTWTGVQKISRKAEWPDWHPPTEMIERQPYLPRFMAGGPGNPLGARAMYLGNTVYRIHGTNQPSTIGKFVSSGCIGMLNEDVSDLFDRVKVGTRVVVLPGGPPPGSTTTASAAPVPGPNAGPPLPPANVSAGTQPSAVPPLPPPVTVR
ncbi:MAG TPA: L,D-transpeptidase family protein [Bradyrhizobium sp.]|jgi:lipoprotein-anchoring transpeptidase ErfK/SrfK|nr:L,D-transpeptidase family protein [Bradyrhizobium sp.]